MGGGVVFGVVVVGTSSHLVAVGRTAVLCYVVAVVVVVAALAVEKLFVDKAAALSNYGVAD